MTNQLRVFHTDRYKLIPHWDLHDMQREYYDDKLTFLIPIMEMSSAPTEYLTEYGFWKYSKLIDFPKDLVNIKGGAIVTNWMADINMTKLKEIGMKRSYLPLTFILSHF